MTGDIGALVVRNDLGLDPDKVKDLSRLVQKGSVSYLSPDKEGAPFLLYMTGQDLPGIALRTNYPIDVLLLTAMKYNWIAKAEEMKKSMVDGDLASIKNDIVRMLLVATHTSMQKELSDILSGRSDAKHSQLIPKNIKGLKDLLDMVDSLSDKVGDKGGVNVTGSGNNIQVNLMTNGEKTPVDQLVLDLPKSKVKLEDFS
jgi:hypothetical protein